MQNRNLQAVVWDVDNTLIMSGKAHDEAVLEALAEFVPSKYSSNELAELDIRSRAWDESWRLFGDGVERLEQFEERVAELYLNSVEHLRARDGSVAAVRFLHSMNIPQAVVSNSRAAVVDANLHRIGLAGILKTRICRENYALPKPAPDPYLCAAESLGMPASSCVAVEDSLQGALSAKTAGAFVIYWPVSHGDTAKAGDYLIGDLGEIDWKAIFKPK